MLRILYAAYDSWPLRSHCSPAGHVWLCRAARFLGVPQAGWCWDKLDKIPMPPPPRRWE